MPRRPRSDAGGKLRIAIVAPSLDILGGHSVQARSLLHAWATDPDVDAWLVPINPSVPAALRVVRHVRYLRTVANEAMYIPLLFREIARADVVHVFSASYWSFLLAPLPAMVVARLLRRPVVLNYHSGLALDHLSRSPVARLAIARADCRVVPSEFLARVFEQIGLEARVVPNVVDIDQFPFRERNPLRPAILTTRNLTRPYNVACTLRAFADIQRVRPDASLTVVGSGDDEPRLHRLARELGLRRLSFVGRVPPDAMADIYADHDFYVQSPDADNMPLSVLEAFASGLPVVSTDVGGMPTILTHGRHGLLAPANDHVTLSRHVLSLLEEPDRAREMARAARATVEAYTWPPVRNRWVRVYRSLLGRNTPETVAASA